MKPDEFVPVAYRHRGKVYVTHEGLKVLVGMPDKARRQFLDVMPGKHMWPGGPDLWDIDAVMNKCYEIKAHIQGLGEAGHSE